MDNLRIKIWLLRVIAAFLSLFCVLSPIANIAASAQTAGDFSVHAVIPDNQVDTRKTYFDLRMEPNQKQTIQILINNSQTEDLTAHIRLNAASTGRNGLIVYTEPGVRDESMEVAITDVAVLGAETVTVPARSSTPVDIHIQMPNKQLDGVILGGIVVTADKEAETAQPTENISLNNAITYVVGFKLTESDTEVEPDFDLAAITPTLINYRTSLAVTLFNKVPRIIKNMQVAASVYQAGSNTVLHELTLTAAEMAPLSMGDFIIDLGGTTIQAGNYRLRMTAEYEGKTWEWDEEFTITNAETELNKEALGLVKDYRWLYLLIGLAALIITAFAAFILGKRKRKEEDKKES